MDDAEVFVTVVDEAPTLAPKPGARLAIPAEEGGGRREAGGCCDDSGGGCCRPKPPVPATAIEGATLFSIPTTLEGLPAATPLAPPPGGPKTDAPWPICPMAPLRLSSSSGVIDRTAAPATAPPPAPFAPPWYPASRWEVADGDLNCSGSEPTGDMGDLEEAAAEDGGGGPIGLT